MAEPTRARPKPTPETQHFWDGPQAGELRLQRFDACANVYFPPRPFCPACASRKVSVFKASGKGKLYSYVIHHRPVPGFTPPYAIAVVELDEGPRMMSNIVDCPQTPEALELDMKLEVAFEKLDDTITLPLFRPAKGEASCAETRLPSSVLRKPPNSGSFRTSRRSSCMRMRHSTPSPMPGSNCPISTVLPPRSKRRSRSRIISGSRRPGSMAPR